MSTPRHAKPARKATAAKVAPAPTGAGALPPLPEPFTDLLTDAERRELHATGMDEQGILTFISCVWLGLLFEEWAKLEFEAVGKGAAKDASKGGRKQAAQRKGAKRKGAK